MQNPGVSNDHGPNLVAFVQMSIFGKKATMLVASSYLPRGCVRPWRCSCQWASSKRIILH